MDLSALASATTGVTALSSVILVSPQQSFGYQPQTSIPVAGLTGPAQEPATLLFHYEGEQSVTLEADITDHFIEDNTTLQDQVALKPIIINTHGYIGELNDVVPPALAPLKKYAEKLTVIGAYTPELSASAIEAYNQAAFIYSAGAALRDSLVSKWSGLENQTKQADKFLQFSGYFSARVLFTVQTPWGAYKNMVIKSLRAIQDAETKVITDFEVSFKQLRFATTEVIENPTSSQGRGANQSAALAKKGAQILSSNTPFRLPQG